SDLGSSRRFEGWGGGEAKMSVNTVPASASHGNLDEQIAQLMQCKPLLEQEVLSLSLSLSLSLCLHFDFCLFRSGSRFLRFLVDFCVFVADRWGVECFLVDRRDFVERSESYFDGVCRGGDEELEKIGEKKEQLEGERSREEEQGGKGKEERKENGSGRRRRGKEGKREEEEEEKQRRKMRRDRSKGRKKN
ncbi:hypothetical protein BHE74_00009003, partial [Ensete ventricosum]